MARCHEKSDAAAQRVPHDVGLFEVELLDQGDDVFGHRLDTDRAIDIRGPTMSLQIDGNDSVPLGECRQIRTEHLDGPETAV